MANIKYSVSGNTNIYVYLYRLQELLKLEHNAKGTEFREGKITEKTWLKYKNTKFEPSSQLISEEICKYREILKKDTTSKAKLSDIEI